MFAPRLTVLPPRCAGVVGPVAPILAVMCFSEILGGDNSLVSLLGMGWFFLRPFFKVSGYLAILRRIPAGDSISWMEEL